MRPFFFIGLLLLPAIALAQGNEFVPLTTLPGIDTLSNQDSLAPFLSQVYKMCIGLAAVLAVLQIMRAGIMYMGGDSITEKKEAKNLIGVALAGLLLVLSPVIVFSIINPDILKLDLDVSQLTPQHSADGSGATIQETATNNQQGSSPSTAPTTPTAAVFYKFSSTNKEEADTYLSACSKVPAEIAPFVQSRSGRWTDNERPKNPPPGQELATFYTVYCESTSKPVPFFHAWQSSKPSNKLEWQVLPAYATSNSRMINACSASGGKLSKKDHAGFLQLYYDAYKCSTEDEASVKAAIEAHGGNVEQFRFECGRVTYLCKAP